jgi:hypothetical protein
MPAVDVKFIMLPGLFPDVPMGPARTLFTGTYDLPPMGDGKCADAVFEDIKQQHVLGDLTWVECQHTWTLVTGMRDVTQDAAQDALVLATIKKTRGGQVCYPRRAKDVCLVYMVEPTTNVKNAIKKHGDAAFDHVHRLLDEMRTDLVAAFARGG